MVLFPILQINMRLLVTIGCMIVFLHCSYAPPVTPDKSEDSEIKDDLVSES